MQNIELDSRISHLKEIEIYELMDKYYNTEIKVADLLEQYNIKNTLTNELYKLFPPVISNKICPYCGTQMIIKKESRTNSKLSWGRKEEPECPKCGHINSERCMCKACSDIRKKERLKKLEEERKQKEEKEKQKRELINETYSLENIKPINLKDIHLVDKIFLGTVLRGGLDESYLEIKGEKVYNNKIAPTTPVCRHILKTLLDKNILVVNPNSPLEGFEKGNDFPKYYFLNKVKYIVNIVDDKMSYNEIIDSLINLKVEYNIENSNHLYGLWNFVALNESIEYLQHSIEKANFGEFQPGEKTISILKELLNNFSVAEIYYIIYHSITKSIKYYHENNITIQHARNTVITNIQNYGERIIANNWEITKYRRSYECKQSILSQFLFNRILEIGEEGFNSKPQIL